MNSWDTNTYFKNVENEAARKSVEGNPGNPEPVILIPKEYKPL